MQVVFPDHASILQDLAPSTHALQHLYDLFARRVANRSLSFEEIVDTLWECFVELQTFLLQHPSEQAPEWLAATQPVAAQYVPHWGRQPLLDLLRGMQPS